jgi:hypothetical protein
MEERNKLVMSKACQIKASSQAGLLIPKLEFSIITFCQVLWHLLYKTIWRGSAVEHLPNWHKALGPSTTHTHKLLSRKQYRREQKVFSLYLISVLGHLISSSSIVFIQ